MKRVLVHVEGQTEEEFVNEVLAPHFRNFDVVLNVCLLGNARSRSKRQGTKDWQSSKCDLLRHLREDPKRCCTTMIDYFRLPMKSDQRGWPGRVTAADLPAEQRGLHLAEKIFQDVDKTFGGNLKADHFIPFVMIHEFEALLFSDCHKFSMGISQPQLKESLQKIRNSHPTPEEINDAPDTAPSKRIKTVFPGYQKVFEGNLAALEIGLPAMRAECPNFGSWISRLEALA